jgi:nitrous oxide reductase
MEEAMKKSAALILTLSFFAVSFFVHGCENIPSPGGIQKLRSEIEKLRDEVDTLKKSVESQADLIDYLKVDGKYTQKKLSEHSGKLFVLESQINRFETATFDFGEKGYSRLDCESGFFLVVVEDVKPFANGVRVSLRIGNPLSATFRNFTVKAKWGKTMPKFGEANWSQAYYEWTKSLTEKEFSFH